MPKNLIKDATKKDSAAPIKPKLCIKIGQNIRCATAAIVEEYAIKDL